MLSKYHRILFPLLILFSTGNALAASVTPSMLKIERFSAERGDVQSQYFLGEHYELGDSGVKRDLTKALMWYRKAAEKGSAAAQYKIGLFHENGYAGLQGGKDAAMAWYVKAEKNGSEEARKKLNAVREEEKKLEAEKQREKRAEENKKRRQLAKKNEQKRLKVLRDNKPAVRARPVATPKKSENKPNYSPEQLIDELLSRKWVSFGRPAEYLPATDMSCLKTGDTQITCFSKERKRVIKDSSLKFSVKSVLSQFKRDGSFAVSYFYNVTNVDDARRKGPSADPFGLRLKEGWQKPGMVVNCRINQQDSVRCAGSNKASVNFIPK